MKQITSSQSNKQVNQIQSSTSTEANMQSLSTVRGDLVLMVRGLILHIPCR